MLLEWQDSQRKVKTPPNIKFHDKEIPSELTRAFPQVLKSNYSNGLISFSKLSVALILNFRTYRGAAPQRKRNGSAPLFPSRFPPIHALSLARDEDLTALANAQTSRNF